jgi:hypothetical protein
MNFLGPNDRKKPMAARLAPGDYDQPKAKVIGLARPGSRWTTRTSSQAALIARSVTVKPWAGAFDHLRL